LGPKGLKPNCKSISQPIHPTEQLNKLNTGYKEHTTMTKVSHGFYRDNLRLIGKTQEELQKQMQIVTIFSDDINREFGLDKCTKVALKKNKIG